MTKHGLLLPLKYKMLHMIFLVFWSLNHSSSPLCVHTHTHTPLLEFSLYFTKAHLYHTFAQGEVQITYRDQVECVLPPC